MVVSPLCSNHQPPPSALSRDSEGRRLSHQSTTLPPLPYTHSSIQNNEPLKNVSFSPREYHFGGNTTGIGRRTDPNAAPPKSILSHNSTMGTGIDSNYPGEHPMWMNPYEEDDIYRMTRSSSPRPTISPMIRAKMNDISETLGQASRSVSTKLYTSLQSRVERHLQNVETRQAQGSVINTTSPAKHSGTTAVHDSPVSQQWKETREAMVNGRSTVPSSPPPAHFKVHSSANPHAPVNHGSTKQGPYLHGHNHHEPSIYMDILPVETTLLTAQHEEQGFDHPYCISHCVTCKPLDDNAHPGEVIRYRSATDQPWSRIVNLNPPKTDRRCACGKPELCDCETCRRVILKALDTRYDYRTEQARIDNNKFIKKFGQAYLRTADGLAKIIEVAGVLPLHRKRKADKHVMWQIYKDQMMHNPPANYHGEHGTCKAVEHGLRPLGYECLACANCTPCM